MGGQGQLVGAASCLPLWVLGIELWSSGLVADIFPYLLSHLPPQPTLLFSFLKWHSKHDEVQRII